MDPQVVAAVIAASVGILTLIGTVIAQIVGFRSTRANTEQQILATHKDTADTLEQQREQLDRRSRSSVSSWTRRCRHRAINSGKRSRSSARGR